jgi:hypothetical protein
MADTASRSETTRGGGCTACLLAVVAFFVLAASDALGAAPQARLGKPVTLVGRTGLNPPMLTASSANRVQAFAWVRFRREVRVPSRYTGPTSVIQARVRRADGSMTATQTLSPRNGRALAPAVGVDGHGVVTAAWLQQVRRGDLRLVVSTRRSGGRFGPPLTIGRTRVPSLRVLYPRLLRVPYGAEPALAVGADGSAVVAWRGSHALQVAVRRPGRCPARARRACFSQPQSFRRGAQPKVVLDASNRAYVTWTTVGGTGAIGSTGTGIELAVAPLGRSLNPTRISPVGERPSDPAVAVTRDGSAIVVWGGTAGVQAVVRSPSGTMSTPLALSDGSRFLPPITPLYGGASPTVVADPQGEAIVVWQQQTVPETGGGIAAAVWSSAGIRPSQVVDAGQSSDPMMAVDGRGDTVLVYSSGAAGFGDSRVRPPGGAFGPGPPERLPGSPAFVVKRKRNAVTLGVLQGVEGERTRLYDVLID